MRIDPQIWPVAKKIAKQFVLESYPDEVELFDEMASLVEQRLETLDWCFEISPSGARGALGFSDAVRALDTGSILMSLAVPMLMTVLPLSTHPSKGKIEEKAEEVALRCGAPGYFQREFKKLAPQIYEVRLPPDGYESFQVREVVRLSAFDGSSSNLPAEKVEDVWKTAISTTSQYDLVLKVHSGSKSILHIRRSPSDCKPQRVKTNPQPLQLVQLNIKQTKFLLAVLQSPEGIPYKRLAEACGVRGRNFSASMHNLKSSLIRDVNSAMGLKAGAKCWLGHRIRASDRRYQIFEPKVRFCIFQPVVRSQVGIGNPTFENQGACSGSLP